MNGSLRQAWEYFAAELWEPLADYSTNDALAPPDLFSDLFVTANGFLSPRTTDTELEELRNDPLRARQRFLALKGTDFTSESAIVHFLEGASEVIADYEIPGFEDLYRRLLRDGLRKFNLRYRLDEPFSLRFLLPGSFANLSFAKTGSARLSVAVDLSGAGDVTNTIAGVQGGQVCNIPSACTPQPLDVSRTKSTTSRQAARRS